MNDYEELKKENERLTDIIDNKLGGWIAWSKKYGNGGISLVLLEEMFKKSQRYDDIAEWFNTEIARCKISTEEYAECFDGVKVGNETRKELLKSHIGFCENALKILD